MVCSSIVLRFFRRVAGLSPSNGHGGLVTLAMTLTIRATSALRSLVGNSSIRARGEGGDHARSDGMRAPPQAGWRRGGQRVILACAATALLGALSGCTRPEQITGATRDPRDAVVDAIRGANLQARAPVATAGQSGMSGQSPQPMLFPGSDVAPTMPRDPGSGARWAASEQGAAVRNGGVEINFDGADIRSVAKSLLGDILGLNFVVDQRIQGNVTLASAGPIARKDVLPVFESVLRMSNAALVRDGDLMQIVPMPEASGDGAIAFGAGQPGFGVSIVPLRYTSAATLAKTAENFLTRPGAVRVDAARNLLLIQGTTADRQAALDVIAAFDVEWLRNQSVGIYPLKSTSPDTMIRELEQVFEASEGGQSQGVIKFQPVSRMNAVMVVTRNQKYLDLATQWVQRLDRSDTTGTTVRIYQLRHGRAPRVAKILNEMFGGQRAGAMDTPANQIAPGTTPNRLDAMGTTGTINAGTTGASAQPGVTTTSTSAKGAGTTLAGAFANFTDRWSTEGEPGTSLALSSTAGAGSPRGVFQNVRISADTAENAIVVYSNQEDYRVIERAMHELDRPQMQVAIDAMVAEVTLTDNLQYGVQYFLSSGSDKGSVGLFNAAAANAASTAASTAVSTVQSALLQRVLPGYNLLLGPEANPRAILSALSALTAVKVLSAPSVVVMDSQPALLQVGDEVPITTGTATVLSNASTVNTIEMRNTGVILKVLPHVSADGTIQLEIEQEISNVVNQTTQTLTPTIAQRRIHSTVAVTSGQTVLLGGLISEREEKSATGLPGLQNIAILGDLFGNKAKTQQRSEIVVFIKPQLIRNGLDARNVAEEFRERLHSIRDGGPIVKGVDSAGSRAARR
jgi:general secretion pathway protein D